MADPSAKPASLTYLTMMAGLIIPRTRAIISDEQTVTSASEVSVFPLDVPTRGRNEPDYLMKPATAMEGRRSSVLEASSQASVPSSEFCDPTWLPMLAKNGFKVGGGNYGDVYVVDLMCDQEGAGRVAVKKSKEVYGISRKEIEAWSSFDHVNIIKFLYNGEVGYKKTVMMEPAFGGDLQRNFSDIDANRMPQLFLEGLQALKHLHDNGWVHSDIKPEQFLLSSNCRKTQCHVKLADFGGVCKDDVNAGMRSCDDTSEDSSGIFGTPGYFAPEQIHPRAYPKTTKASDMWAMGMTLYFLTHGGRRIPDYYDQDDKFDPTYAKKKLSDFYEGHSNRPTVYDPKDNLLPLPLQTLLTELLMVDRRERANVSRAIELATSWAAEWASTTSRHFMFPVFPSILLAHTRPFVIPSCFDKCLNRSCGPQQVCSANITCEDRV